MPGPDKIPEKEDAGDKAPPPADNLPSSDQNLPPTDNKSDTAKMVQKGMIPSMQIDCPAQELHQGDTVKFNGDKWTAQGTLEGKVILFQKGRGDTFAGRVTQLDGPPDPKQFTELKIEGKDTKLKYYADKEGRAYQVSYGGNDRYIMAAAHDVVLADPNKLQIVERATERHADRQKQIDVPVDKNREPFQAGEEVTYKAEKLKVAGYAGEHAILFQSGRNRDYAVMFEPITDRDLKSNYQEIKVILEGKEQVRYIEKGHPERGIYSVSEFRGGKQLNIDHQFEVARTRDLPRTNPETDPEETGKFQYKAKQDAPPKELTADKAADIRMAGDHKMYGPMQERTRNINGIDVKVRMPISTDFVPFREVEIQGRKIELTKRPGQAWFYSREPRSDLDQQVKLHVTGISPEDVAKLQTELLPLLDDMQKAGDIKLYKTFDTNFMDANWNQHKQRIGRAPGATGQESKAFTIYLPPEKAAQVAKIIDKYLAKKGLNLDADVRTVTSGDYSRVKSNSRRVSVEKSEWKVTRDSRGDAGALLETEVSMRLTEKYKSYGTDTEGKLTREALRKIEKEAGIREGQIGYDKEGRLMFKSPGKSGETQRRTYYMDESGAENTPGKLTGRLAIYAIYEKASIDPAELHLRKLDSAATADKRPPREVASADKLTSVATKARGDGTLDRREVRTGEALAREQMEKRERVDAKEIESMRKECEELEKSGDEKDRVRAAQLRGTVDALEGKYGPETQREAHRAILDESRRLMERGEGGGYGTAVVGGFVSIGILVSAGLSWYHSMNKSQEKPLQRAKVGR